VWSEVNIEDLEVEGMFRLPAVKEIVEKIREVVGKGRSSRPRLDPYRDRFYEMLK